jgi:hypothetical protein
VNPEGGAAREWQPEGEAWKVVSPSSAREVRPRSRPGENPGVLGPRHVRAQPRTGLFTAPRRHLAPGGHEASAMGAFDVTALVAWPEVSVKRPLSGAVPVYAAPDQDVCGVDMSLNSVHAIAA